jgi:hypothetical protein
MPVYGHSRASGIRPDVYVGSAVLNYSLISSVSRPFRGVLLVAMAGGPQAGLTPSRIVGFTLRTRRKRRA